MVKQVVWLELRSDEAGDGQFGARRGERTHRGVDVVCQPDAMVLAPVAGVITRWGYAYADDLAWRYVEITESDGDRHRLFYVDPDYAVIGDFVSLDDPIGDAQDITEKYPDQDMTPHIHYEVKNAQGQYIDPTEWAIG